MIETFIFGVVYLLIAVVSILGFIVLVPIRWQVRTCVVGMLIMPPFAGYLYFGWYGVLGGLLFDVALVVASYLFILWFVSTALTSIIDETVEELNEDEEPTLDT